MIRFLLVSLFLLLCGVAPSAALQSADLAGLKGRQALEWRGMVVDLNAVMAYYDDPSARILWVERGAISARGQDLLQAIARAGEDGLDGRDYLPLALSQVTGLKGAADEAGFELAMSQAFLALARDLHSGRTSPSVTAPDIVIARKETDARGWLSMVRDGGVAATLRALEPQHVQYAQLRQLLAGYRALAARGGWPAVPEGPSLKPGMRDARITALRTNMRARGYSGIDTAEPAVYDEGLQAVVEHFQTRHGLDADGVVGPATLRAVNVPADQRVRQIIVNMERWRWLPADLGRRHVFVNQAGFEMFTIDRGRQVDRRRVIVGKPFHKSPMFSDRIRYAEFNPTWTVPTSIARSEMLPKLQSDPSWFDANNYSIHAGWGADAPRVSPYGVDWSAVPASRFNYRIVQGPGPKNALGQVKFMFPNKFDVYLHDTPSRQLFARTGRAFSHGCIRVNGPLEFAELLFGLDQGLPRAKIDAILASGKITRVNLKTPVPVHLAYFTAWVDDRGVPSFFEDVYERDVMVARLLSGTI